MRSRGRLGSHLGVNRLKRLSKKGPEAFEEIYQRLRQLNRVAGGQRSRTPNQTATLAPQGTPALPQAVLDRKSLALAI